MMRRRKTLPEKQGYYCFSLGSSYPKYDREKWTIAEVRWAPHRGCLCYQIIGKDRERPVIDTSPRDWGTQLMVRKISKTRPHIKLLPLETGEDIPTFF
jgi:hypothetical protein